MPAEATLNYDRGEVHFVTAAALTSGEVIQLCDGRAAVVGGLSGFAAGEMAVAYTKGIFNVLKTANVVVLDGGRLFWVRSTGKATPLKGGGDFYVGVAVGDAASADTTVDVELNTLQTCKIELGKGIWDTVLVAAGAAARDVGGSNVKLSFTTAAEAQKADLLSRDSISVNDGPILEARLAIYDVGDNAALDFNIGLANGTHASDTDSITESVFFHIDGTALDIKAESDDGTTEVAATDTTVDAVDDTYLEVWIDARDKSDIQLYINGVLVLGSSTFTLAAATGPMKALVHLEKSSDDTPGDVRIESLTVRSTDLT